MKKKNYYLVFMLSIIGLFTIGSCSLLESDPCEDVSCENGGTCDSGTCDCPDGFSGTNCEIEDLCITNPIACENGGTANENCTECECVDGYSGDNCSQLWRDKLTDSYLVTFSCSNGYTETNGVSGTMTVDDSDIFKFRINYTDGDNIQLQYNCLLTGENSFDVSSTFENGTGTITEDGVLKLELAQSATSSCSYSMVPQ